MGTLFLAEQATNAESQRQEKAGQLQNLSKWHIGKKEKYEIHIVSCTQCNLVHL